VITTTTTTVYGHFYAASNDSLCTVAVSSSDGVVFIDSIFVTNELERFVRKWLWPSSEFFSIVCLWTWGTRKPTVCLWTWGTRKPTVTCGVII